MLDSQALTEFAGTLRGRVVQPGDADYDDSRRVYNAMIDRHPRLIVYCRDVADVMRGVNFARQQSLRLSMRSGGHNAGGLGVCDDGLVLDLSAMKGIRVDRGGAHRACRRRLHLGRCRPRHACLRHGHAQRHHRHHRRGRPHPRRRPRPPDAQVRPDGRQPARGRRGAGRRPPGHAPVPRRNRTCSGACAAAAAISAWSRPSCSACTRWTRWWPARPSGRWSALPRSCAGTASSSSPHPKT